MSTPKRLNITRAPGPLVSAARYRQSGNTLGVPPIPTPDDPDLKLANAEAFGRQLAVAEAEGWTAEEARARGIPEDVEMTEAEEQAAGRAARAHFKLLRPDDTRGAGRAEREVARNATRVSNETDHREKTAAEMISDIRAANDADTLDEIELLEAGRQGSARQTVVEALARRRSALAESAADAARQADAAREAQQPSQAQDDSEGAADGDGSETPPEGAQGDLRAGGQS